MHVNIALRYLRESKKHQAIARSVTTIGGFLGFAFFAALVLVAIEGPHEVDLRVAAQAEWHRRAALRNESIQMLQSVLVNHSNALGNLSAISDELLQLAGSVPLVEEDHARWDWTLPGAIYFVFTVVTTIGYGNFTPQTAAGRTWTVVFGFFGIGMFAVFVERISVMIQAVIKGCWIRRPVFLHRTQVTVSKPSPPQPGAQVQATAFAWVGILLAYWMIGAAVFEGMARLNGEQWSFGEAVYFAAVTFLTVGLGDYTLGWNSKYRELAIFIFMLFSTLGMVCFLEGAKVIVVAMDRASERAEARVMKAIEQATGYDMDGDDAVRDAYEPTAATSSGPSASAYATKSMGGTKAVDSSTRGRLPFFLTANLPQFSLWFSADKSKAEARPTAQEWYIEPSMGESGLWRRQCGRPVVGETASPKHQSADAPIPVALAAWVKDTAMINIPPAMDIDIEPIDSISYAQSHETTSHQPSPSRSVWL